jgi:hypothetical protein
MKELRKLIVAPMYRDPDLWPMTGWDPGETTGAVKFSIEETQDKLFVLKVETFSLDWPHDASEMGDLVLDSKTIVVEKFALYSPALKGSDMPAAQAYGGILLAKHWTWGTVGTGPKIHTYRSREASALPIAVVKGWLDFTPLDDHEIDATRVLLWHLMN